MKSNKILIVGMLSVVAIFLAVSIAIGQEDPDLAPFDATVTVGNEAPFVSQVYAVNEPDLADVNPGQVDPISGTTVTAIISFIVEDNNGAGDITGATAQFRGPNPAETLRPAAPAACVLQGQCTGCSINQANYSCTTITLQYYDDPSITGGSPEDWEVLLTVDDPIVSSTCSNDDTSGCGPGVTTGAGGDLDFFYNELRSLQIETACPPQPDSECQAIWSGISLAATDQEADGPMVMQNRGNVVLDSLEMLANDLVGQTTPAEEIPSELFSISSLDETDSTPANGQKDACDFGVSAFTIPAEGGAAIPIGGVTQSYGLTVTYGDGTARNDEEDSYFCIWEDLSSNPGGLSAQSYAATGGDQWDISVL